MRPLDAIALEAGTDKSSSFHNYAATYDELFGHLRNAPCKILEIGVLRGESMRMWLEGFPQAEVHGVDIKLSNTTISDPRLTLHEMNAASPSLRALCDKHGPFDFVIEDSKHHVEITRPIVQTVFPNYIKPGGWMVIEDTHAGWSTKKKGVDGSRIVARHRDGLHIYARSMVDAVSRNRWIDDKTLNVWPEVSIFDAAIRQVVYRPKLCMIQKHYA